MREREREGERERGREGEGEGERGPWLPPRVPLARPLSDARRRAPSSMQLVGTCSPRGVR